jgi:hypothetical protein
VGCLPAEDAVKGVERGASGAPPSGLCSLTAVRAEATERDRIAFDRNMIFPRYMIALTVEETGKKSDSAGLGEDPE